MACIDAYVLTKESTNIISTPPSSINIDVTLSFPNCSLEYTCVHSNELLVGVSSVANVNTELKDNPISLKYGIICGIDDSAYIRVQEGIIEINHHGNPVIWEVKSNTNWIVVVRPWSTGENISVSYNGDGDGSAIFSSDYYDGIERKTFAKFIGGKDTIERTIRQEGIRQQVKLRDGGILYLKNGERFGVLKVK